MSSEMELEFGLFFSGLALSGRVTILLDGPFTTVGEPLGLLIRRYLQGYSSDELFRPKHAHLDPSHPIRSVHKKPPVLPRSLERSNTLNVLDLRHLACIRFPFLSSRRLERFLSEVAEQCSETSSNLACFLPPYGYKTSLPEPKDVSSRFQVGAMLIGVKGKTWFWGKKKGEGKRKSQSEILPRFQVRILFPFLKLRAFLNSKVPLPSLNGVYMSLPGRELGQLELLVNDFKLIDSFLPSLSDNPVENPCYPGPSCRKKNSTRSPRIF